MAAASAVSRTPIEIWSKILGYLVYAPDFTVPTCTSDSFQEYWDQRIDRNTRWEYELQIVKLTVVSPEWNTVVKKLERLFGRVQYVYEMIGFQLDDFDPVESMDGTVTLAWPWSLRSNEVYGLGCRAFRKGNQPEWIHRWRSSLQNATSRLVTIHIQKNEHWEIDYSKAQEHWLDVLFACAPHLQSVRAFTLTGLVLRKRPVLSQISTAFPQLTFLETELKREGSRKIDLPMLEVLSHTIPLSEYSRAVKGAWLLPSIKHLRLSMEDDRDYDDYDEDDPDIYEYLSLSIFRSFSKNLVSLYLDDCGQTFVIDWSLFSNLLELTFGDEGVNSHDAIPPTHPLARINYTGKSSASYILEWFYAAAPPNKSLRVIKMMKCDWKARGDVTVEVMDIKKRQSGFMRSLRRVVKKEEQKIEVKDSKGRDWDEWSKGRQ